MKNLELEAKKYANIPLNRDVDTEERYFNSNCVRYDDFIAGATSNASKEYWKKQLEKQKLEFAIEQLREFEAISWSVTEKIEELEKQLNELNP